MLTMSRRAAGILVTPMAAAIEGSAPTAIL
jgi:hypothetical protein